MKHYQILTGDAVEQLQTLPDASIQCCVTSPPYYGLRDYGVDGQLGLDDTPEAYIENMVNVFREVKRVLRKDGTCWVNMGDSYMAARRSSGLKPKDLMGMPWRLAFALQADGWWLRQDIIWHKPNPMPESATDRCTKSHEYIFLLTKSAKYYYDADAIREPAIELRSSYRPFHEKVYDSMGLTRQCMNPKTSGKIYETRNKRSVWTITAKPYPEAHFATFPPEIPELCIRAGCPEGGTVLDPFSGAGTTGVVALRLDRGYIGIELNQEYVKMSKTRIHNDAPLFNVEI